MSGFLTYYLNVPIFFGLYFGYKVIMRTKIHPLADIDLVAGKAVIEAEDAQWTESIPRNIFEKVSFILSMSRRKSAYWSKYRSGSGSLEHSILEISTKRFKVNCL